MKDSPVRQQTLQTLQQELAAVTIELPLHQQALKLQLLARYPEASSNVWKRLSRRRRPALLGKATSPASAPEHAVRLSIGAVLASSLLLSFLIIRSALAADNAQQLALAAVQHLRYVAPAQATRISNNYEAIERCLQEALQAPSLYSLTAQQVNPALQAQLRAHHLNAPLYLLFTNTQHHRIVIALDAHNTPQAAADIDKGE